MSAAALKRTNKNSVLGSLWSLVQPFIHMIIISYIFSIMLKQPPELMIKNLAAGITLWGFLSNSLQASCTSLITREHIIKRFRTSKSLFIISDVSIHIVHLLYSILAMFVVLLVFFPSTLTIYMVLAPILALPMIISVTTISIAIGFMTPYIRDIPQMVSLAIGTLYWTLPIIYPYNMIPDAKKIFFEFHPIFHLMRPMQYLFTEQQLPGFILIVKACIVMVFSILVSYYIYRKLNRNVIYYL
jgi:lipopolysaccharide transport system permease protein